MNLREAMQDLADKLENDFPCTEAAREISQVLNNPEIGDGCSIIEFCENDPVLDYDSEPF